MDKDNNAATIGTYFEQFISNQVATGRFSSNVDVLQAGLRLLEEQQLRLWLEKSRLDQKDAAPVDGMDGQSSQTDIDHTVAGAMRAMASAVMDETVDVPAIPATKGLLRSRIAAE